MNYGNLSQPAGKANKRVQQALGGASAERGLTPARDKARSQPMRQYSATAAKPSLFSRKLKRKELVNMTSQLAIMTRAGVDIAGALQSLVRQCRTPVLRTILGEVHEDVLGGNSLSESLAKYDRVFGKTYIASVAAGEASGRLPEVLGQLAGLLRSDMKLHNSLRTMLAYPVILTAVSSLVLLALLLFVLPQFQTIFADFEAPLPAVTRMLLVVSSELRSRYWLWGPLLVAGIAGLVLGWRSPAGRRTADRLALHVVVLRDVTRALFIGRTCRLLGLMIESGVPLLDSLRLARSSVNNSLYRDLFNRLEDDVLNGRGLANALLESEFIPGAASEMVVTAEKTGTLGTVTQMIGEHYQEEGEARLKEVVAMAEPAITLAMGCVVAVIVMSVMLPLFDLSSAAKGG